MKRETVQKRNTIIRSIRSFFDQRGYLEVETPVLSPFLIPESTIGTFETTYYSDSMGSHQLYLTPSPEIFMKRLIAEGFGDIFQITKSFRNNEQRGRNHNPEFTMLEWYTMNSTAEKNISLTEELFDSLASVIKKFPFSKNKKDFTFFTPPFKRLSMEELFYENTGIDLAGVQSFPLLREALLTKGYTLSNTDETWESLFNRIFLNEVEPNLPQGKPLILYNYPAKIDCLAADIPGTPWKDRWELYVGGIEIANCYTEETDSAKVASFMRREYAKKTVSASVIPDMDNTFSALFTPHYPECSGVALGIDRIVRLLTGEDSLGGVILFPLSDILKQ